jgi:hypothetical protein
MSLLPRQQPLFSFLPSFLPSFLLNSNRLRSSSLSGPHERPVLRTVSPSRLAPQNHKSIGNANPRMGSQHKPNTNYASAATKHVLGYLRIRSAHAKD